MIAQTEREYTVRNRALTGMPGGEVPLDLVVDSQLQKEWFDGVLATYPEDTRMKEAERRIRTQPKFDQLQRYREFDAVLGDLTTYIANVIPWPSVTGGLFWGVSAVPGTAHVKGRRRLFTVNAHNVELLYTHDEPAAPPAWSVLNVHRDQVTRSDCRRFQIENSAEYRSYPAGCSQVILNVGELKAALESPSLLRAARTMALGLMRRGPSNFAKFHCDALLDRVLVEMGRRQQGTF
jgi:hypothetical protein